MNLPARTIWVGVTLVLLVGAVWAAKLDYDSVAERYSVPLDIASGSYKVLAATGLVILGRRLGSQAMYLLAVLVGLLFAGSLFVNSDWSDRIVGPVADGIAGWLPLSGGTLHLVLIFLAAAVLAGALVVRVLRVASAEERGAVLIIVVMLGVVGVFLGPINAISTQGWSREWLFAEDFGQVLGLAVLAGYVWGLVGAAASPGSNVVDTHPDRD